MTTAAESPAWQSFRGCGRKFYRLCATHRVVGEGARAHRLLPPVERLDALRKQMKALSAQLRSAGSAPPSEELSAGLTSLAHDLDTCASEIRQALPKLDLSLLRGCLPRLCQTDRTDVASFLDLCLEPAEPARPLMQLIEYVVTVLATDEENGHRSVGCDPATLTSRLAEITAAHEDETSHGLHLLVSEAIAEMESRDRVQAVIGRMREHKAALSERFFVPDVLRAVVDYNVTVGNRLQEITSAQRVLDETESAVAFDLDEDMPQLRKAPKPIPRGEGLAAVVRALRDRIEGGVLGVGPAGAIAAMTNTSELTIFERRMLSSDGGGDVARSVRTVIVLGLLLRHRRVVKSHLAELGIDWDQLESSWVPHARDTLQAQITTEIAEDRYHESRSLAVVLTRYLPAGTGPREERSRPRTGADGAAKQSHAIELGDTFQRRPMPEERTPKRPESRVPRRQVVVLSVALAVLAALWVNLIFSRDVQLAPLTPEQLVQISPYLESATRDGEGSGPSLIGRLDADWVGLGGRERSLHVEHIAQALRSARVQNAILFDERRRLQLHYTSGKIAYLRAKR